MGAQGNFYARGSRTRLMSLLLLFLTTGHVWSLRQDASINTRVPRRQLELQEELDSAGEVEDLLTPAAPMRQFANQIAPPLPLPPGAGGCPFCDASVYSYCSLRLIHDACCCEFPVAPSRPPECFLFNCGLLFAKSCFEHQLIKHCCCLRPF